MKCGSANDIIKGYKYFYKLVQKLVTILVSHTYSMILIIL